MSEQNVDIRNMIPYELDINFKDISTARSSVNKTSTHFYYDESGNVRRYLFKDDGNLNAPDKTFALGGIVSLKESCTIDVEGLHKLIGIQPSAKEIKFRHIKNKSKNHFFDCLSSNKVTLFLEWLANEDLYIHFTDVDLLYYVSSELIDSLKIDLSVPIMEFYKNCLHQFVKNSERDFLSLLYRHNFPTFQDCNISSFYHDLINWISAKGHEPELVKILKYNNVSEMEFLGNNDKNIILDNLHSIYMKQLILFNMSSHHFDQELKISDILKENSLLQDAEQAINYEFLNSIDTPLIQISDCIVGLLRTFHEYVYSITLTESSFESLDPQQWRAGKLIAEMIYKSEQLCPQLFSSITCQSNRLKVSQCLYEFLDHE